MPAEGCLVLWRRMIVTYLEPHINSQAAPAVTIPSLQSSNQSSQDSPVPGYQAASKLARLLDAFIYWG